jgi:hypothetical protein
VTLKLDLVLWKDTQRLLEPLEVTIPYAEDLTFPAITTTDRRDNQKLLSLIAAHALLYQRQRKRDESGRIVAAVEDYAAVYGLVRPVVEASVDGLSSRGVALYRRLLASDLNERAFTRREVAAALGWSYMTATRALRELSTHELVRVVRAGEKPARYRLLDKSVLGSVESLMDPSGIASPLPRIYHRKRRAR